MVNVTDRWRERNVWYQGRSCQQVKTEYETCSNNEWQEVSRGQSIWEWLKWLLGGGK